MFERICAEKCCGCGACAAICAKTAISMKTDDKGFLYPAFDEAKCVNCNLCLKVCPARSNVPKTNFLQQAYVCQNKSTAVLRNSTSGGAFTSLTDAVFAKGGVVYGAIYDEKLRVVHCRAENKEMRDRMCGSKYVQSDICLVFEQILNDLRNQMVFFSGTPCQVDAVKRYCENSQYAERLITCDIVCYGVPSPKVFESHISYLEKRYRCKITNYWHRPSYRGFQWGCDNDAALKNDGEKLYGTAWINAYRKLFYSGVSKRDCCYSCRYTSTKRVGDITIADCRQAKQLVPEWDLSDGISSVLVNTERGMRILEAAMNELRLKKVSVEEIDQPPLHTPCAISSKRDLFFETLRTRGYKNAVLTVNKRDFALRYWIKKKLSGITKNEWYKKDY